MKPFVPITKDRSTGASTNLGAPDGHNTGQIEVPVPELSAFRTSIQRMHDAKNQPEISKLLSHIWLTNELQILFADTGIGKSILAVAISDALSKGESLMGLENENAPLRVLYYDFELSDRQFRKRYTDEEGNEYPFNENFFIDSIDFVELVNAFPDERFSDILFKRVCHDIEATHANVLIIDNLTYLNSQTTQDTQIALNVMRELNQLKKAYNLSVLVLAHTPKRDNSGPISLSDLAGSKHLSNFSDGVFAIGRSVEGKSIRYIKQIKPSRSSEMVYDSENVIACEIMKSGSMLTFDFLRFDNEYEHLQKYDEDEKKANRAAKMDQARELKKLGKTLSEIALEVLGDSNKKGTISKWLNEKRE